MIVFLALLCACLWMGCRYCLACNWCFHIWWVIVCLWRLNVQRSYGLLLIVSCKEILGVMKSSGTLTTAVYVYSSSLMFWVTHGHTLLHHWSQEAQKWRKKIKETKNKKNKQATNTRRSPWPDFVHQAEVGSADVESLEVNEDHHELLPRHNGSAVSMAEVVLQEMSHLLSNSTSAARCSKQNHLGS